jgi:hypothetical protein
MQPRGQFVLPPHGSRTPGPLFSSLHDVRPDRIAFHISQNRQQVLVLLDGKSLESSLPHMSAALIVTVVAPHMRRQQPLHPTTQIAVAKRPQDHVEVVAHHAVGQYPQRQSLARLFHQRQKRREVLVLMEHVTPRIPTVDYVIAHITDRSSCCSWHKEKLPNTLASGNIKVECPPLLFLWTGTGQSPQALFNLH